MTGTVELRSIYSGPIRRALEQLSKQIGDGTGPQGPPGPPGPAGPAGGTYTHSQATPLAVWTITHGLGYRPNVTVVDSSGSQVEGDITYSGNDVIASFSAAFSGTAYLS